MYLHAQMCIAHLCKKIMERKMNKNFTMRMSPRMMEQIERDAAENESSCSQIVRTIIARHYRHMEGIEA